jgi:MFS family permease
MLSHLLVDTRPLRESPEYRRLWVGGALSGLGSQITAVAVPVQIYALTHSSLAVGTIGLALAIPRIMVGLLGGSIADVVDRRKLVLVTSSLLTLVSLGFAAQAYLNLQRLWLLYILTMLQSSLVAIDAPTRRTFVSRLLPPE